MKQYRRTRVRLEFVFISPCRHQGIHSKLLPLATIPGAHTFIRAGLLAMGLKKGSYGYAKWQLATLNDPKKKPAHRARKVRK